MNDIRTSLLSQMDVLQQSRVTGELHAAFGGLYDALEELCIETRSLERSIARVIYDPLQGPPIAH
jgi:hypothetical protein